MRLGWVGRRMRKSPSVRNGEALLLFKLRRQDSNLRPDG
jgi:hypothetical protein